MTFDNLNLHDKVLQAIAELGYTQPTPVQSETIPIILDGSDIMASAQTGTGKTAAFILPALNRLATRSPNKDIGPRVLVLVPTRELAMQVATEAVKYTKYLPHIKTVCVYGGVPYPVQNKQLRRPYDILIATPGRLIDHLERQRINLSKVEIFILDEADRMLDMGFIEPVEFIAESISEKHQTLLFSATLKKNVIKLSKNLLNQPKEICIDHEHAKHESIEQRLYYVDNVHHKQQLLDHLLSTSDLEHVIVFTATKRFAEQLAEDLFEKDYNVATLHGDMNQRQRTRTITKLRKGAIQILVATDVAARGIDINNISHVINFDLPNNVEDYVHRIGRTGRAGSTGIAISFAAATKEYHLVKEIEGFTGQTITPHTVEGLEPKLKPSANKSSNPRFKKKRSSTSFGSKFSAPRSGGSRSGPRSESSGSRFGSRSGPRSESSGSRSESSGSIFGSTSGPRSESTGSRSDSSGSRFGSTSGPRSESSDSRFGSRSGPRSESSGSRFGSRSESSGSRFGSKSGPRSESSGSKFGSRSGPRSESSFGSRSSGSKFGSKSGPRSASGSGGFKNSFRKNAPIAKRKPKVTV